MKKIIFAIGILIVLLITAFILHRYYKSQPLPRPVTGGEAPSVSAAVPISTTFCNDTLAVDSGTLCAIQPSLTDSHILDVSPATGAKGDESLGFGYHVLGIPDDLAHVKGIWVHFTGTYGRPYNQKTDAYDSSVWLSEIMGAGYIVIQLAYDNRFSVNGELCGSKTPGYHRDNCAGEVREIALSGKGTSPYRSTDEFNTIDYRLKTLFEYLTKQGVILPITIDPNNIDWSKLSISGHSQGANQAYYIAKERPVARVCILAGAYDTADTVNPGKLNIADWFTTGVSATPISRIGAFLTTTDDSFNAFKNGLTQAVGLPLDKIIIADHPKYYDKAGNEVNGHAGTQKDPSLKDLRAKACFAT
jgi:hypothetical protein